MLRRSFLAGTLGALGIILSSNEASAKRGRLSDLIAYGIPHESKFSKKERALRTIVRREESYESISRLYTGSESNSNEIRAFNNGVPLVPKIFIFIPLRLVRNSLRKVLDDDKFVTYEIAPDGEAGINNLWELAQDFMNSPLSVEERVFILLAINLDINPKTQIVQDGQRVLVPISLVAHELVEKPEKSKPATPKPIVGPSSVYQNPFRTSKQHILDNIRPRDQFKARRIRGGGRRFRVTRHTGLDLVAKIGTPLYPIQEGVIIRIGRDFRKWRNGIRVDYKTNDGIIITYCHLKWFNKKLKVGSRIKLDTLLGTVGISGNASRDNPHVHVQTIIGGKINGDFEVIGGSVVNPFRYVVR